MGRNCKTAAEHILPHTQRERKRERHTHLPGCDVDLHVCALSSGRVEGLVPHDNPKQRHVRLVAGINKCEGLGDDDSDTALTEERREGFETGPGNKSQCSLQR